MLQMQADMVFLTNDNQRSEKPEDIIADIVAGFPEDLLEDARGGSEGGYIQDCARFPLIVRQLILERQTL